MIRLLDHSSSDEEILEQNRPHMIKKVSIHFNSDKPSILMTGRVKMCSMLNESTRNLFVSSYVLYVETLLWVYFLYHLSITASVYVMCGFDKAERKF